MRRKTTPAGLAICSLVLTLAGFASLTIALVAHGALQTRILGSLSAHLPVLIPAAFAVVVLGGAMATLIMAVRRKI